MFHVNVCIMHVYTFVCVRVRACVCFYVCTEADDGEAKTLTIKIITLLSL